MSAGIDEGYIAYQELFDLSEKDTGFSVSMRCITLGVDLVTRLLDTLQRDPQQVPRRAQDLARRRYFGREKPFGGRVPLSMTAAELARFVRASDYSPFASPWGHPVISLAGRDVSLVNIRLTGEATQAPQHAPGTLLARDGEVWLATADQWVALKRLARDGKPLDPHTLLPDAMRDPGPEPSQGPEE